MPRLKVIYEPKGKAREYAEFALNPFMGCNNMCEYCYGPRTLHMTQDAFHGNVTPRKDILKSVERDAKILKSAADAQRIIEKTRLYTDHYKIGKLNYHPHAKEVNWKATISSIVDYCEKNNVNYTLKKDTAKLIRSDLNEI